MSHYSAHSGETKGSGGGHQIPEARVTQQKRDLELWKGLRTRRDAFSFLLLYNSCLLLAKPRHQLTSSPRNTACKGHCMSSTAGREQRIDVRPNGPRASMGFL